MMLPVSGPGVTLQTKNEVAPQLMSQTSINRASSLRVSASAGFTLVEMAVVVLIAAILLTAGLSMVKSRLEAAQIEVTQKKQDAIKQALIAYLGRNLRLPCPDVNLDGREDRDPAPPYSCGLPGVPQNFGGVPYSDLSLDRSAALDGWENYMRYIVSPNWRFTYGPVNSVTTANTAPPSNAYVPNAAFVPKVSQGTVAVYTNVTTAPALDPCVNSTGAVVALVSHGKNGFYATNVAGNANAGPAGPTDETQNAAPTSDPPGVPAYGCAGNVFRVVRHDATNAFDDVVLTISESEFTAPLIASGALQGSPEVALNKANDLVIGAIVGNRSPCPEPNPGYAGWIPCAAGSYYTLPVAIAFPPELFGMVYARGIDPVPPVVVTTIATAFPLGTVTAYTLTAAGGLSRVVTVNELRGVISRGSSFN
jgi:prepilin-type N-terminal cleavage/methylation domain-containing protein